MSFSDHRHVVGTITDCKSYDLRIIFLDKPDNVSFLAGRHPAADNRLTSLGDLKELLFEQIVFKDDAERFGFNKDAHHFFVLDSLRVFADHFICAEIFYAFLV